MEENEGKYTKSIKQFYDGMDKRKSLVRRTIQQRFMEFMKRKERVKHDGK